MRPLDERRLELIIQVQRAIMACGPDVECVMRTTVEHARTLTGADGAAIEIVEDGEMVYRAASGTAAGQVGLRLRLEKSLSGLSVKRREILHANDTETDPRVDRAACRAMGARSMVVVPLVDDQACIGALVVMAEAPGAFDAGDVAVLQMIAGFVASAMSHAAAHDAVVASEHRFRAVAELALDAIATLDGEGRVTFWNGSAERLFGYRSADLLGGPRTVVIPDLEAAKDRSLAELVPPPRESDERTSSPPSERLVGKVVELVARDADGMEVPIELALSKWDENGQEHYTAVMRDIRERKRREAETLERLRIDPLTGLLVRREGEEAFRLEVERSTRYQRPIALALFDLDHFKRVNDTFGHQVGDDVLGRVGSVIRRFARGSDVAVRWGGEELLVLLAETPLKGALEFAERIRAAVAALPLGAVGQITISAGVTELAPGEALDAAIARVDAKLYEAKHAGRNRVVS